MKRFLSILSLALVLLLTSLQTSARVNYRGFVDIGGGIPTNFFFSTTHGVQTSRNFYVGIGTYINGLQEQITDGHISENVNTVYLISPYISGRYDFASYSKHSAFIQLNVGAQLPFDDCLYQNKNVLPFITVSGGYRYAVNNVIGLNIGPYVSTTLGGGFKSDDIASQYHIYYKIRNINFGIQIGVDF